MSVITGTIEAAVGIHAPGHLELTQIVDFALVDAVLAEIGAREACCGCCLHAWWCGSLWRSRVFQHCCYQAVWRTLTAVLGRLALVRPAASWLARARRRLGTAPLRRLFEVLAGPVADGGQAGAFYRGLRTVAIDGTGLHVPDEQEITWRYPKRCGGTLEFGYPLLRLVVVVDCGTRAVLAACFGRAARAGSLPTHRQSRVQRQVSIVLDHVRAGRGFASITELDAAFAAWVPQRLRSLKPRSTGARAAGKARLAWRWAGMSLLVRVAL